MYLRLFTLLEDECHALDVEMALLSSPQSNDRQAFIEFAEARKRERVLLDEKEKIEGEVKSFKQTLAYLALHGNSTNLTASTTLTSDPRMIAVATAIMDRKRKMEDIVSNEVLEVILINNDMYRTRRSH